MDHLQDMRKRYCKGRRHGVWWFARYATKYNKQKVYGVADMQWVRVRGVTSEIRRTKNKTWGLKSSTRHDKTITLR